MNLDKDIHLCREIAQEVSCDLRMIDTGEVLAILCAYERAMEAKKLPMVNEKPDAWRPPRRGLF